MVSKILMGRLGQVDEVAALVCWLASAGMLVLAPARLFDISGAPRDVLGKLPMPLTIYGIKNCDTMKKARAFLDKRGVAYAFHDYKTAGIEKAQARRLGEEGRLGDAC